jgi:hypothetical protein
LTCRGAVEQLVRGDNDGEPEWGVLAARVWVKQRGFLNRSLMSFHLNLNLLFKSGQQICIFMRKKAYNN